MFHNILRTKRGQKIVDYYDQNQKLNDIYREELIDLILETTLGSSLRLNIKNMADIANQIAIYFPNENEVYICRLFI